MAQQRTLPCSHRFVPHVHASMRPRSWPGPVFYIPDHERILMKFRACNGAIRNDNA